MPQDGQSPAGSASLVRGRFVLVVEDDDFIREGLLELLEQEGHVAAAARDGVEALEILQTSVPCMMLLDWMMPRMGGAEVLQAVRLSEDLQKLAIVVMSAQAVPAEQREGMAAFVSKPLDIERLLEIVNRFCPAVPLLRGEAV